VWVSRAAQQELRRGYPRRKPDERVVAERSFLLLR
jgi:hypothetical protein